MGASLPAGRAAWIAVFAILLTTAHAAAAGLTVTVLSASGTPQAGASVCVGTANDRGLYGTTYSQGNGTATFADIASSGPGGPANRMGATVLVTARKGASFVQRNVPSVITQVVLMLPAALASEPTSFVLRGPVCPQTAGNGGATRAVVDQRAIVTGAAEAARRVNRQPFALTPINTKSPPQHCFGAVGAQCDVAFCVGDICAVSGGSWEHDECCFRNYRPGSPEGMGCAMGPVDEVTMSQNSVCNAEWSKATLRQASGFFWLRNVNRNEANATGVVDRAEYCALDGAVVHREDAKYCCSGNSRPANGITDAIALNGRPWIEASVCMP